MCACLIIFYALVLPIGSFNPTQVGPVTDWNAVVDAAKMLWVAVDCNVLSFDEMKKQRVENRLM